MKMILKKKLYWHRKTVLTWRNLLDLDEEERAERRRQQGGEEEERKEAEIEEEDDQTKEINHATNIISATKEDMEQGKGEYEEENMDAGEITNGKRMREGSQ